MDITVWVSGIPKGQPRPRAFASHGRARVYDPGTAEAWKGAIALAVKRHVPATPYEGPIMLSVSHYMPRPKGHFGSGKNADRLKPNAPTHHTGKPDVDNLLKAAMDALTQMGIWRDDNQVVKVYASKVYANSQTGANITIKAI